MIEVGREGPVHVVRMRAGDNRLNLAFVEALEAALATVESAGGPFLLVGEGKAFSTGLDLEWMAGDGAADADRCLSAVEAVLGRILTFPAVTAAVVNGHAFGAGALLAGATDYRWMRRDRGFLCYPEVDLGLTFSPVFEAILRAKYPAPVLHDAWISGRRYGGDDAVTAGLMHGAEDERDLLPVAVERLSAFATKPGHAVGALKRQLYRDAVDVLGS